LVAFLAETHPAHTTYPTRKLAFAFAALLALILTLFMAWVEWRERNGRRRDKDRIDIDMGHVLDEAPRFVTETTAQAAAEPSGVAP
jgi:hypothetical protein